MKKIITCIFFIISFQTLTLLHPNFVLAQTEFGYNIHSLTKESPETITNILNQVASKCGANIIRLWGYQSTMGIDGINNLDKVLNAAGANIKFIVTINLILFSVCPIFDSYFCRTGEIYEIRFIILFTEY